MSLINDPDRLLDFIESHMEPKDLEKKKYGEVFTPIHMIRDLFLRLPPNIFTIPELKWLDPACGIGNFSTILYYFLLRGLQNAIPNFNQRRKHILENMIYTCEINPKNVSVYKKIFKEYKLNIYEGDFFQYESKHNFDVIMGNPPYNSDSGNKGNNLWPKFIYKSLNMLNPAGYLVFITPRGWRSMNNDLFIEMSQERQLDYLEIHDVRDGLKNFKCNTTYDSYIIENIRPYKKTIIIDVDNIEYKIDIRNKPFIPNGMISQIYGLISNTSEKCDANYYRTAYGADKKWVSRYKSDKYKYPVIYTIDKNDNPTIFYSSTNENGQFGLSKFIFSNGSGLLCDPNGQFGITEWSYCIYDKKTNLKKIEKCFRNKEFAKIIKNIQTTSQKYNIPVMKLFKKDFYKEFIQS